MGERGHDHSNLPDVRDGKAVPFAQGQNPLDATVRRASGGPGLVAHFANTPVVAKRLPDRLQIPGSLEQREVTVAALEDIARPGQAGVDKIERSNGTLGV